MQHETLRGAIGSRRAVALALALGAAAAAGCEATPAAPPPRGHGVCRYFPLANGEQICLLDRPQGLAPFDPDDVVAEATAAEAPLIDPAAVDPLPVRHDLRDTLRGCLQVRQQGECAMCVAMAVGTALDALHCAEGCPPPRVSTPHLWSRGNGAAFCDFGWQIEPALAAVTETALVPESTWAFADGARAINDARPRDSLLASAGRYAARGHTVIVEPRRHLDLIKRAIASGRVVVVGVAVCMAYGWQDGARRLEPPPRNCGRGRGSIPDGYHAVALVGYDDERGEFIGLNSMGDGWGQGGYFTMSYRFARSEMTHAGYLGDVDRSTGACPDEAPAPSDRCAAIAECTTCTSTSGCVMCDGRCVAADHAGTAPASGACAVSTADVRGCPPSTDACSEHRDCGACAASEGCGWCGGSATCVSWPSDFARCSGERMAIDPSHCNDATRACDSAIGCEECIGREGCGYCLGVISGCFGGTAGSTDRLPCVGGSWFDSANVCPTMRARDAGARGAAIDGAAIDGAAIDGAAIDDAAIDGAIGDAAVCQPAGGTCADDGSCCSGLQCVASTCRDPATCRVETSRCDTPGPCCRGLSCLPSTFGGATECCIGFAGGHCDATSDCCGEMLCESGGCVSRAAGQSCASEHDCAGSLRCVSGTCGT
jgi:hypothetical protein